MNCYRPSFANRPQMSAKEEMDFLRAKRKELEAKKGIHSNHPNFNN